MSELSHDDLPTPLEAVFAARDTARAAHPVAPAPDVTVAHRAGPPPDAPGAAHGSRPRLRLVPAPEPAAVRAAPRAEPPPTLTERVRRLSVVDRSLVVDEDDRGAPPTTDPRRFAHGVGIACVEAALGRRPAAQLARWVAPGVLDSLQRRADLVRRTGVLTHARQPAARRVRVCAVDPHAAEACLVVDDGVRVRAVALRIEAHRGTWRVTTLDIG
ncbi:Rv3235 family protein [Cellulomonas iranensis]|uniref:Rv3235 family protein n=1 Tax=Cellulomonas iranensis TaxID=76862 RepID=UPI003D7DF554